jgi:hypothetical protein
LSRDFKLNLEAEGQNVSENQFPASYDNPQKIKIFEQKGRNVSFWFGLEDLTSNLYERAFLTTVLETKAGFINNYPAKSTYRLSIFTFEGDNIDEKTIIVWIEEALKYMSEIKAKSTTDNYSGNLKREVHHLRQK